MGYFATAITKSDRGGIILSKVAKDKEPKELSNAIKLRIIELCHLNAMTQQKLSYRSDVTQSTLSDIMRGKVNPKVRTIAKVALAFGMTLQEFFDSPHFENISLSELEEGE